MALDGDTTNKQQAFVIGAATSTGGTLIPANPLPGCCSDFVLKVLADGSGLPLQNDATTEIQIFDTLVTGATFKLKKWENGAWVVKATISNNNYGKYSPFGYYTNADGQNFIKLEVDFAKILAAFDEGSYKFTCTYTIPFGSVTSFDLDSNEYCLKTYSAVNAEGTIRLEFWNTGQIGNKSDDTKVLNYGTEVIYKSLRLQGFFGYPKFTFKEETVEYTTGENKYVEDYQMPIYKMTLKLLPFFIHEILRIEFMMADTLAVTDYNSMNNASYVQKYLRKDSAYEPIWHELQSNFATVKLTFKPQFNRTRKFRN